MFVGLARALEAFMAKRRNLLIAVVGVFLSIALIVSLVSVYMRSAFHNVYFDTKGGSLDNGNALIRVKNGHTIPFLPTPTKSGYSFTNWYLESDLDTIYSKQKIRTSLTLHAGYNLENYTISYNLGGGVNNSNNPITYNCQDLIIFASPTKSDNEFVGWYLDSIFQTSIASTFNQTKNLTLYAKWNEISIPPHLNYISLTLQANGGSNYFDNYQVAFGEVYGDIPNPIRPHYQFLGWYSDSDFLNKVESSTIYNDLAITTLYAKWTPLIYTITYHLDGGSYVDSEKVITKYSVESPTFKLPDVQKDDKWGIWYYDSLYQHPLTSLEIPQGSFGDRDFYSKYLTKYLISASRDEFLVYDGLHASYTPEQIEALTLKMEYGYYQTTIHLQVGEKVKIAKYDNTFIGQIKYTDSYKETGADIKAFYLIFYQEITDIYILNALWFSVVYLDSNFSQIARQDGWDYMPDPSIAPVQAGKVAKYCLDENCNKELDFSKALENETTYVFVFFLNEI
jgi:uncharacterized repeat protein (TIGR02543 family)